MPLPPPAVATAVASPPPPPPEECPLLPSDLAANYSSCSEHGGSGEGMIRSNKRRSSVAFAPVCAFTPEEGTPPDAVVRLRESVLEGSGLRAPLSASNRRVSTGSNVSWAPEVRSPPKSRERLHKQARRISDAALDEAENAD